MLQFQHILIIADSVYVPLFEILPHLSIVGVRPPHKAYEVVREDLI